MSFHLPLRRSQNRLLIVILAGFLAIAGFGFFNSHAVHASGPIIVNSLSDDQTVSGACSQVNTMCLRQAIGQAGSINGGATINFSVIGTIIVGSPLVINNISSNPVTIDGTGNYPALSVAISGGNTGGSNGVRIMTIGTGTSSTVNLINLVFGHGYVGTGDGGAIYNGGTLTVTNCAFVNNSAQGVGGALENGTSGTALISNTTFTTNFVNNYGGAVSNDHNMVIANSTFNANTTSLVGLIYGGAVKNSGALLITNSTFTNNTSGEGGAIVNYGGSTTISNSTISGNSAQFQGGGIYNTGGPLNLFSNIVAGNTILGSGIGTGGPDVSPSATSYGYNLIGDGSMSGIVATTGDQIGTAINPINPQLGALQNNGGPTYTMATSSLSAASTAGNCNGALSNPVAPTVVKDQRNDNRKNTGNGLGCDMGAYESNPPVNTATATSTATATATNTPTSTATPSSTGTSTPTPGSGTLPAGVQIIIQNFSFNPNSITVPVGTTVIWINQQNVGHTTTSDTNLWASPVLGVNQWFAFTFTAAGDYSYHCAIHTSMKGVVHVVAATNTATATNTPSSTSTATNTLTSTSTSVPVAHVDTIGIYRGSTFYLRLHNSTGPADLAVGFNIPGLNLPIVGDWTGAGVDTVGVYNQSTGFFTLCTQNDTMACANAANQKSVLLGNPNDTPLSGRWQLTATNAGVGVFRFTNGILYLKNALTSGFADYAEVMGNPGDVGLAGDWTGKGFDSPGIYRPTESRFYLSNVVSSGIIFADMTALYGNAGDAPVIGDWIAQGHDGIGLFRQTSGYTYLRNSVSTGAADNSFIYGNAGDVPVAGHWQAIYPPIAPPMITIAKTATPIAPNNNSAPGGNQIGG